MNVGRGSGTKRDTTRRALAKTFSAQYATTFIFAISSIIVARLLVPEEVGIFSVAAAMLAFGHMLRDFGTGQYVIQEVDLTPIRLRAALTVTLGIGWSIAAGIYVIAPAIGRGYGEEGVMHVLQAMALNFALLPFGTVTLAYLRRNMQFGPAALAEAFGSVIQAIATITLAYFGHSYMSMAWGAVAGTLASLCVAIYYRPAEVPWLPGYREVGRVLSFGGKLSSVWLLSELSRAVPELVLGKAVGFDAVGLFSRAQGLQQLFGRLVTAGVGPVTVASAAETRREGGSLRALFVFNSVLLSGLAWVFYGVMIVLSEPAILLLLGEVWVPAAPILAMLCIGGIIHQLCSMAQPILIATGSVNQVFRVRVITEVFCIAALVWGALYSLEFATLAVVASITLRSATMVITVRSQIDVLWSDFGYLVRKSGPPAAIATALAFVIREEFYEADVASALFTLLTAGLGSGIGWLVVLRAVNHPILREALALLKRSPPEGPSAIHKELIDFETPRSVV